METASRHGLFGIEKNSCVMTRVVESAREKSVDSFLVWVSALLDTFTAKVTNHSVIVQAVNGPSYEYSVDSCDWLVPAIKPVTAMRDELARRNVTVLPFRKPMQVPSKRAALLAWFTQSFLSFARNSEFPIDLTDGYGASLPLDSEVSIGAMLQLRYAENLTDESMAQLKAFERHVANMFTPGFTPETMVYISYTNLINLLDGRLANLDDLTRFEMTRFKAIYHGCTTNGTPLPWIISDGFLVIIPDSLAQILQAIEQQQTTPSTGPCRISTAHERPTKTLRCQLASMPEDILGSQVLVPTQEELRSRILGEAAAMATPRSPKPVAPPRSSKRTPTPSSSNNAEQVIVCEPPVPQKRTNVPQAPSFSFPPAGDPRPLSCVIEMPYMDDSDDITERRTDGGNFDMEGQIRWA